MNTVARRRSGEIEVPETEMSEARLLSRERNSAEISFISLVTFSFL